MSGLVIELPICDYCHLVIHHPIEPIVETRIVETNTASTTLVEVAHRQCWIDINTVVNTVLEYSCSRHEGYSSKRG